ncbi:MAG: hypothetical protein J7K34_06130 [Flavobacteriaceae bacterium]|nr:hypothetical protein [Flavobacteriaceae bacterium]
MKRISLLIITVILFFGSCKKGKEQIVKQNKPNIILIYADDMGYGDWSFFGTQNLLEC